MSRDCSDFALRPLLVVELRQCSHASLVASLRFLIFSPDFLTLHPYRNYTPCLIYTDWELVLPAWCLPASAKLSPASAAIKGRAKYKKAPGAPKRFKSAFIFFSTAKHKEIRKKLGAEGNGTEKVRPVTVIWYLACRESNSYLSNSNHITRSLTYYTTLSV